MISKRWGKVVGLMGVFVIIGHTELAKLGAKVSEVYPAPQSFHLPPAAWYVEDQGTVESVSEKLTIPNGVLGVQAVVAPILNQVGWVRRDVWEWIRPKLGGATDG